jgi:hypothetical protein
MHDFNPLVVLGPFLVPIFAMLIPIVAIIGGYYSQVQKRRIKADQQMAMLARGIPLAEIEAYMKGSPDDEEERARVKDPMRSLGNARRTAIVLVSLGLGLISFFVVLEIILSVRQVLAGAAAGLIPLAIGIGFAIDYQLQKREMSRFGLEVGADLPR